MTSSEATNPYDLPTGTLFRPGTLTSHARTRKVEGTAFARDKVLVMDSSPRKTLISFLVAALAGACAFLLLFALLPARAVAQSPVSAAAIDAFVTERMSALGVPGAAVAIVQNGEIYHLNGYGVAGADGRAVTPDTSFLLASLSKSFTAVAVMQLVEAGRLDLDAPVTTYLPWFRTADSDLSARITPRHLLHHASGFSELSGNEYHLDRDDSDMALETAMRRLSTMRLLFPPGEGFEYSNTNYDVLGLLVSVVTGQSYEQYVMEQIFTPLGMTASYTSLAEARAGDLSSGYKTIFGVRVPYDQWTPYARASTPSAGLFSSANDMAHYLIAHLEGGRYGDSFILSEESVASLHRSTFSIDGQLDYAFGWHVTYDDTTARNPILFHGGTWANYRTTMMLVPHERLGIVVLMNTNDETRESVFDTICYDLGDIMMGRPPRREGPREDLLVRNALPIAAAMVVVLILGNLWWRRMTRTQRRVTLPVYLFYALAPTLLEWALAYWLLADLLPGNATNLALSLRFAPDLGLLFLIVVILTLGVGTVRSLLWLLRGRGAWKPNGTAPAG